MDRLNVEIKAKCSNQEHIRRILQSKNADYRGTDHQIDTYFNVNTGRLKLREGSTENCLIYYNRDNVKTPKQSEVILFPTKSNSSIKRILTKSNGVLIVIDKRREIFFIDNVTFHLDKVDQLGTFIEIEAQSDAGTIEREELKKQCQYYVNLFEIKENELVTCSYSDLLLEKST